jgi:four helix bundle protein
MRRQREGSARMGGGGFQNLVVWRKAHTWVLEVYRLTRSFPKEELYVLTSQLRRAAVSVPANIVEGFRKRGRADKIRFFNIAQGSLDECHYYLILARDLGYANTDVHLAALDKIHRMLNSYSRAVAANDEQR